MTEAQHQLRDWARCQISGGFHCCWLSTEERPYRRTSGGESNFLTSPAQALSNRTMVLLTLRYLGTSRKKFAKGAKMLLVDTDTDCYKKSASHQQPVPSDNRVCSRRQKKYESPQSTLVVADGTNAAGRSWIERWAMSAEMRLMAKPA